MKALRIFVSGLYSGPNPSPGVGITRSLRQAFPDAEIIGVDYSPRSTGLHWPDLTAIWLQRPWNELDLHEYCQQINELLSKEALWVSGLDLEALWLANEFEANRNILSPTREALQAVRKPSVTAAAELPFQIPPFLAASSEDTEVHEFCRLHNWQVWLKGAHYEARPVNSWQQLRQAHKALGNTWGADDLFVQSHIAGQEESVAFCAYHGTLLGAVQMTKAEITPEGKTWAGRVSSASNEILEPLGRTLQLLRWTGGGELELVREACGARWLLEWNPRFPAWIHGATIAGTNLPALLVSYASNTDAVPAHTSVAEFARVVIEIPVRADLPLPSSAPSPSFHTGILAKHPSGMPTLAQRITIATDLPPIHPTRGPSDVLLADLAQVTQHQVKTPYPLFLPAQAEANFKAASSLVQQLAATGRPQLSVAYSMKTNPDPRLLRLARRHGLLIEVIGREEHSAALASGWKSDHIILNGPAKRMPANSPPAFAIFCDSLDELRDLVTGCTSPALTPRIVGVRLRPPSTDSRFGIPLDSVFTLSEVARILRALPVEVQCGTHFHFASSVTGPGAWWQMCEAAVSWTTTIQTASRRPIDCMDLGGGWLPEDWRSAFTPRIAQMLDKIGNEIPSVKLVIVEPGKALTQECFALITSVVEVRNGNPPEVVVDGSIAELPQAPYYPHPLFWCQAGRWHAVGPGSGRILGRLCMEDDIVARDVAIPVAVCPGDLLAICEAGAYDRSMAYIFGQGPS